MANNEGKTFFAPELYIDNGIRDISFYEAAFGAKELRRFSNEDGSIHVAEISIDGALFHLHEITAKPYFFSPGAHKGTTVCIGLFVNEVDSVMKNAIKAGALEINPAQDYEYGYRQGTIKDPFGHYWQIQSIINEKASQ
jgi:PhnB protein